MCDMWPVLVLATVIMIINYGRKTFIVQANDFHTNLRYPIEVIFFSQTKWYCPGTKHV
jgi:hypothetical protein